MDATNFSIVKHLSSEPPTEIKNPNHTHPLMICNIKYENNDCIICEDKIWGTYHRCETCWFHLCRDCVRKPLLIEPKKSHEHTLSLVPRCTLAFTCLACGINQETYKRSSTLCICIPCCFMIHRKCVSLPRVIYINRHDHRISYISSLDEQEDRICKVCRKKVDWRYGSYSCSTCFKYTVHSKCATNPNVWDEIDLEGVPEEDPETILPFKMVGEGVIKYFSHDHNLRLITIDKEKDDHGTNQAYIQCNACVGHIYSDPYYKCTHDECSFVLHEVCANLLQKKRHFSHSHRLTLITKFNHQTVFECDCCGQATSGFVYGQGNFCIDVRCASILDGFVHGSHPHPLYFNKNREKSCSGCTKKGCDYNMMNCEECEDFALCFRCTTLPYKVKHKYDKHVLSLCYGEENLDGVYWCEICEKRLDSSYKWFYTCGECCCSTFHIHCVLGEDPYIKFGGYSDVKIGSYEVIFNNYTSFQPNCYMCPSRFKRNKPPFLCHGINVFKSESLFYCSYLCLRGTSILLDIISRYY